ncbi:MAG: putative Ig domain-containing protein [Acidobacteria bacterium]|nr:putative Ig domain-containing protein [Acidobacteriota bacterium]
MKLNRSIEKVSLIALSAAFIVAVACFIAGVSPIQIPAATAAPVVACPPSSIDGVIGSGSTDWPFVTGNQTSRLFRNAVESSCGTQKPTPTLTDVGTQFKFDAFSFSNTTALPICVTVITTPTANGQLFAAAYDGSFNPNNVQANYLGDAGDSDGTHAFSFVVPGNHNFVIVQSRVNTAANPPSLAYSFKVLGVPTCNSCPPQIISGTIGSGSAQWPATIDTQTGRLFRDAVASVCSPAKPVPSVTDASTQFTYDAYTFLNTSVSTVCVTVNTTAGAPNQILTAAYLDRYNRLDVQENYLGDAGNSDQLRSFSFNVPGKRSFTIVQSRVNTAANPTSLDYFFSVSGLTGCTACPVIDISPNAIPNARMGQSYSQQLTRTGGAASGTWSIVKGSLPSGLTLNPSTGLLSGTPTVSGNFNFSARFTDSNGCLGEIRYFLQVVVCPTIDLTPSTLSSATVGVPYSQQLGTTAGTPTFTFSLFAGSLPPGLTLSSSGLISGTLTSASSTNFTVRVTDAFGCIGNRTYTIIGCNVVTVNPATAANGFAGQSYTQNFSQSGGAGTITWSVSAGALPPGLTQNTGTGAITGTPTVVGTFDFTARATSFNGCFGERAYTVTISGGGLQFYPLAHPVRLLDTRAGQTGCDAPGAVIPGGSSRTQTAAGRTCDGLTIPASARSLVGNITTVQSGGGFLTLYPSDAAQPNVANSNYAANQILNNVFTVGLGAGDGAFKIFVTTDTNVVVDITGYYAPPAAGGLYFHPLPKPVRLMDTRAGQTACFNPGSPLQANSTTSQLGQTACDGVTIPAGAQALVGNATTVNPLSNGFLTLFPADAAQPLAASSNFQTGINMNAPFTVGLSPSGQFNIFTAATTDLVIDVLGYFSAQASDSNGQGLLFNSLAHPVRLLETRQGFTGCTTHSGLPMAAGTENLQPVRGTCDGVTIANNALGIVGNATVINQTSNGFLTFWPSDAASRPLAATSNYRLGQVFNRHFTVGLGTSDGRFKIFSSATTDLIIDVSGFFAP